MNNFKELEIKDFMEKFNLKRDDLQERSFWNNNPHLQVLQCFEGLPYAVMFRENKDISLKHRKN